MKSLLLELVIVLVLGVASIFVSTLRHSHYGAQSTGPTMEAMRRVVFGVANTAGAALAVNGLDDSILNVTERGKGSVLSLAPTSWDKDASVSCVDSLGVSSTRACPRQGSRCGVQCTTVEVTKVDDCKGCKVLCPLAKGADSLPANFRCTAECEKGLCGLASLEPDGSSAVDSDILLYNGLRGLTPEMSQEISDGLKVCTPKEAILAGFYVATEDAEIIVGQQVTTKAGPLFIAGLSLQVALLLIEATVWLWRLTKYRQKGDVFDAEGRRNLQEGVADIDTEHQQAVDMGHVK